MNITRAAEMSTNAVSPESKAVPLSASEFEPAQPVGTAAVLPAGFLAVLPP
jgi:hypothetical protein